MKADIQQDNDNWLTVYLEAETPKEASKLVRLGMNMGKTPDVSVHAGADTVSCYITVRPTPARSRAEKQKTFVQFHR